MRLTELIKKRVSIRFANKHGDYSEIGGQITQVDETSVVFQIEDDGFIVINQERIDYISDANMSIIWRKETEANEV